MPPQQPPPRPRRPSYDEMRDGSGSSQSRPGAPPSLPNIPPSLPPPPLPMGLPAWPSPRTRFPPGVERKNGGNLSRPTMSPNWPLPPGSPLTLMNNARSPPGASRLPPPRPRRPSRIPSMVDKSRHQQPTPIFLNPRHLIDDDGESSPRHNLMSPPAYTPSTSSSRLTTSSVGTIPEFPVPSITASMPPKPHGRSTSMTGSQPPSMPQPSSRRHTSNFQSIYRHSRKISDVSEEDTKLRYSYASSAAIPRTWSRAPQKVSSPTSDSDEDVVSDISSDSIGDDYGDEINLVRSASIGQKGRAALVVNKPLTISVPPPPRVNIIPIHPPFGRERDDEERPTTLSRASTQLKKQVPSARADVRATHHFFMPEALLNSPGAKGPWVDISMANGSSSDMAVQPPKFDTESVKSEEARSSITSLPDLIKRATRLASMIDRGKRPASRFGNASDTMEKYDGQDRDSRPNDHRRSGFSDILNSFPPPGQPASNGRTSKSSWFDGSGWQSTANRTRPQERDGRQKDEKLGSPSRAGRRCCGMPPWAFILITILLLCIMAIAIVLPLQFFVFKTLGPTSDRSTSSLDQCRVDLVCQNGGTNVVSQGMCSCICTNGFTGRDCSGKGTEGCTTTNLISADASQSIENVTLGRAIPRLIAGANSNFSIPLSGTAVLAKINAGDLSCRAQNSLVTFDGRATRATQASSKSANDGDTGLDESGTSRTNSLPVKKLRRGIRVIEEIKKRQESAFPFQVTEDVLDFGRVSVLYVLQQMSSDQAEEAQANLQYFFSLVGRREPKFPNVVTQQDARNVRLGGDVIVNLMEFQIDIGAGPVGARLLKRSTGT